MSSSANHYRSPLRDIEFNLFEALRVQDSAFGQGPFEGMTEEIARDALVALDRVSAQKFAASLVPGDREPPTYDPETQQVTLPQALKDAIDAYHEGGWEALALPEALGGFGATPSLHWGAFEMPTAANPAVPFYAFGAFIASVVHRLGTPDQRSRFLPRMLDEHWGGAMVLTEPNAGSDVGAARAKARPIGGDIWAIEGIKRYITNGEYDHAKNIMHLVLARPEGAKPGTKGLSMFFVPKLWIDEDGRTHDNHVRCIGLEKKMGLKGSVTCEMSYGEGGVTRGFLAGEVHDGIRQMFHVIEHARMGVGCKSMAQLSQGYQHALAYAKERVQGADLMRATDKTAPRVEIIRHPDVRRMLMAQKAHSEGMRALCLFTASIQDQVALLGGHTDPKAKALDRLNDLLLPLVKGYNSEKAYELLSLSLQCYGGAGYMQDYPIEQYIRDQRIDAVYEGTTHIQSLDLLFRKVARDGGETLRGLLGRVEQTLKDAEGGEALADVRARLARGLADVQGIFMALMGKMGESLYHVGLQGNRVLAALAEIVIGWLLVRHAAIAQAKLDDGAKGSEADFYRGKVASARWFCRNVLPGLTLTRKLVEDSALDLMELPDGAF